MCLNFAKNKPKPFSVLVIGHFGSFPCFLFHIIYFIAAGVAAQGKKTLLFS